MQRSINLVKVYVTNIMRARALVINKNNGCVRYLLCL